MKLLLRLVRIAAMLLLIAAIAAFVYYWTQSHRWPFSTGSRDQAFLGTTFGMSQPEVERTLAKHGARLVSYSEYERISSDHLVSRFDFTPLLPSDERDYYDMYMPSIQMFGANTEAEFEFFNSRLIHVSVYFTKYAKTDSVVPTIVTALEQHYTFLTRKEAEQVPGGYSLEFASKGITASLWVNLTDPKKPNLVLYVSRISDASDREKRRQQRERAAFGDPK
jgi:hypothetical protein